ncbi:MAG: FAD-binding oxidoreductase, partial [Acidobacteria bacterium]|nr:FAD-binding oxidoreductase [Acidobacteriota bacterium]
MSVFHRGEQSMQAAYGMAEKMGEIGSRLFRDFMPDQHRQFFEELPFILVAARDSDGHPVASFLAGQPGFIQTSEREMTIRSKFTPGDWVAPLLKGDPVGLLGIMLHNRRRNRMNGLVFHNESGRLGISVVQSFGNCPKYIQTRERIKRVDRSAVQAEAINFKDPVLRQWIENSDTFFIASQA